jgi:CRISPR-associated protein Cmr3
MSNEQWLFIRPNDVWLFRDNKPFTAQQNFTARGQFPPHPQIMQGAIRTHSYLQGKPIGDEANMAGLTVYGPYVAKRGGDGKLVRYFQAPLDVVSVEDKDKKSLSVMTVANAVDFLTSAPDGWRPLQRPTDAGYKKEAEGWLTETQFRAYLQGKPIEGTSIPNSELYQPEERVGLALDYARRANKAHHFYHAEFTRLSEGTGVLVGVSYTEKLFTQAQGMLRVGGESRTGHYEVVGAPDSLIMKKEGKLKVVLLTPAYFLEGWFPQDFSAFVGAGKLVSVALGKPQAISGWDIKNNRSRPIRHFVPAGSVFYFEGATWQGKPFTESAKGAPYAEMGFGTVAVGTW